MVNNIFIDFNKIIEGSLLLATNKLEGSCFEKAIIYIVENNENGTNGIILNHRLSDINISDIAEKLNINISEINFNLPIHYGGPLDNNRGFIVSSTHIPMYKFDDFKDKIFISSDYKYLKNIVSGNGPKDVFLVLGYAGWEKDQLANEITSDNWVIIPKDNISFDLIFNNNSNCKWKKAWNIIGIDQECWTSETQNEKQYSI